MACHTWEYPQIQRYLDLRLFPDIASPRCPCFFFLGFSFLFYFCYLSDLRFFNGSANGTGSQMRDDSPAAGDRQITSSPGSRRPQTPNKGSPRRCSELSALGEGAPPAPWVLHGRAGCGCDAHGYGDIHRADPHFGDGQRQPCASSFTLGVGDAKK